MNEGLDTSAALGTLDDKPSKQYRSSPYTVREYSALPYCSRLSVDLTCDEQEGITYATHTDETSEKPYTVGRRATTPAEVFPQPSSQQTVMLFLDAAPIAPVTPDAEAIEGIGSEVSHEKAASEPTAALASEASPVLYYDLLAVVSRYITLAPTAENEYWTHCGPSPYVKGDEHSFALSATTGFYKCYATEQEGRAVDFVMFMEECSQQEAFDWLDAHFPIEPASAEVVHESGPLPEPEAAPEPEAPACAYPGFPRFAEPITMESTPDPTPEGEGLGDFAALTEAISQAVVQEPAEPSAPVAIDSTVYHTTNYDLFKILPQNRPVDQLSVRRLVGQIARKNLLYARPLDVTADMEVLDGQHRLAAARELGVPVYYKIMAEMSEEDITILNVAQKNWAPTDYLHNWAVKGMPDYVEMSEFMKRHPLVSFSNAKIMLGTTQKHNVEEFREGKWKVGDIDRAERVAELIERLDSEVPTFRQCGHTQFVSAIFYCMTGLEGFDSKEFMRAVLLQPRSLVPCTSHKQFLQMFQDIYNYRKAEANRLKFL